MAYYKRNHPYDEKQEKFDNYIKDFFKTGIKNKNKDAIEFKNYRAKMKEEGKDEYSEMSRDRMIQKYSS